MIWDRAQIVDFTIPVYIDPLSCLVPLKIEKVPDVLIKPFDWRVWIDYLLVTYFLLVVATQKFSKTCLNSNEVL